MMNEEKQRRHEERRSRIRARIEAEDAELAARNAAHISEMQQRAAGDDEPPKAARPSRKRG